MLNKSELTKNLDDITQTNHIPYKDLPGIDLYMEQLLSFLNAHIKLAESDAGPAFTKTMINNYAKNNLLPSPDKKKYTREHMLTLLFIYYFKNLLSISDIEQLLRPLSSRHFAPDAEIPLTEIYEQIFGLEKEQRERLKTDVASKFQSASQVFSEAEGDDKEYLQLFSFICELAFDVYLKKQMIELLID